MKPGATTCPLASITRGGLAVKAGADGHDPIGLHGDVGPPPRGAAAIDDLPPRIRSDQATSYSSTMTTDVIRSPCLMRSTCSMPRHHLAEHGVVAVEVRVWPVADVELAAGGVGMLAARHGHRAPHVLAAC